MIRLQLAQCRPERPESGQRVTLLVERAQNGDRSAFEELVELFELDIFRMVCYRVRSRPDAEDLTQEIFLQAFKNIGKLKDLARFRSWLFSIAVNRVRDFQRRKRVLSLCGLLVGCDEPEPMDNEISPTPGALDCLLKDEFWTRVAHLARQFSRREREVFLLRYMDELSINEIAQVLKKSESTIKTHLYRALKKFKEDAAFFQA